MKAQGFTLIELLFCMALIGAILSFGGWVYQVFHGFQYRYITQVDKTYDLILLQDRLQKDFSEARMLEVLSPECFRLLNQDQEKQVQYCLREGVLLRSRQARIDSFAFEGIWRSGEASVMIQEKDTDMRFSFHLPPRSQAQVAITHKPSNP